MRGAPIEVAGPAGRLVGRDVVPDVGDPTGLPIAFIHGVNMSMDVWADVLDLLPADRRAVLVDLRGHGASDRTGPFAASDYAADVLAVLDHLGIERAHLVGTSFGGSVACTIADRSPERAASVASFGGMLSADGFDVDGAVAAIRGAGVREFFAMLLPQASFMPETDPVLVARALDAASHDRDVDTVVAVSVAAFTADAAGAARGTTAPALVATGEHDMTCPVPAGRAVAEALGVDHVVIPGVGHVVSMEAPSEVAALLQSHIERAEAA